MKKILLILGCLLFLLDVQAQQRTITGRVVDAGDNSGLPGVSVIVKGTTRGTATDQNGNYSLDASSSETLVFSFIGFEAMEVNVGAQSTISVSMKPSIQALEEIVVIGYGEKSRKLMTESIGTVSSKEITKLPVASADAAIQGRVSGVQVTAVDGTPGAPVAIRIRGVGTVGNTQPLFVIDGVPVGTNGGTNTNPLSTINPSDIESVSVLKDASAAAVYGVRGANGVVLITTKRGKNGAPRISLDSYYGVQNFPKLHEWNSTADYVALTTEAINARNSQLGLTPGSPGYQILNPDLAAGSRYLNVNTDWQTPLLNENAPIQNHHLSVSGGNEGASYFVSAGYFEQEATIRKWDLQRFTFRANGDYKIGQRLRMGQTLTLSHQKVMRGMNGGGDGFLLNSAGIPPFFSIYDTEGTIPNNRYGFHGNANVAGLTIGNQFGINEILDNRDAVTRFLGGIHMEVDILKNLTFRSAASIDFSYNNNTSWQPSYTLQELGLDRTENRYNDSRGAANSQVFTNTLTYRKSFGDHSINALAGIELQRSRNSDLSVGGGNFISSDPNFYQVVRNQRGTFVVGGGAGNEAFTGLIGRISYDYKEKYLLTATFRRDGTSRFAPEFRVESFPSFSAAWRISEEDFFQGVGFISDLKLRASWGQLGNSDTGSFPFLSRVSTTPDYSLNNTSIQAPTQTALPNRTLIWEKVETFDVGFDLSLLNNKISLLATYYNRTTKDFLFHLPLPWTGGFGNVWGPGSSVNLPVNAGSVSNRGIEIELGYTNTFSNGLSINISGNITTVRNRLTALAPGYQEFASGDYRTAVGYPIGYFYGYKTAGLYQNTGESSSALPDDVAGSAVNNRPRPGDVRFVDTNGPAPAGSPRGVQFSGEPDGRITPQDRTYLGKTIPGYFYGLNIGASFKNFDVSILFQGVGDVNIYNEFRRNNEGLGAYGRNRLVSTQDRWTGEGTSNSMPRAIDGDPYQNNRYSDRWIEDGDFLRLRNLQIGYTIPRTTLDATKVIRSSRIYIGASNLFTITGYSGLDPEVMTFGSNTNQLGAGTDRGNMPQPRIIQAGIQLQL